MQRSTDRILTTHTWGRVWIRHTRGATVDLLDTHKVTVRSEISGTHKAALMGFPAKNRKMTIQAIDIHEFKDGKIVRTWHTEG